MKNSSIVQEFIELVKIPVASRDERAIADVVKHKLSVLGFIIEEDNTAEKVGGNTGNIIATLKGETGIPPVLLSAHLDRVKNNGNILPVINEEEGVITSDGNSILAADDVSGICAILDGVRRVLNDKTPHGDIEIVFSVCEELGVLGSGYLDFSKLKSKIAFVFDVPGRLGRIVNQAPTKCNLKIDIKGIKAHAGNEPEKGLNAIKVAAVAISNISEGRINEYVTSNFGSLHGGNSTNVVCDHAEILGEARGVDDKELDKYLETVKNTFADTAIRFNTTIDVGIKTLYHTFHVSESEQVIQLALKAMKHLNINGWCQRGGGGMDGNHFNYHDIQTIGLALGYSKNHTNSEQIVMGDLVSCGMLVQHLIHEVYLASQSN